MPLYEYECTNCHHRFEKIEKFTAPTKRACPKCGKTAERLLAVPAIQFKGSGWYVTDYGRSGSAGSAAGEKTDGKSEKATDSASAGKGAGNGKEKGTPASSGKGASTKKD